MLNVDKLSYWEQKSLFENVDHLIIGSGIVGYSTALHLRQHYPNDKILIIERGYLPSGASSKNAGFACFGSATEIYDDIENFGEELVWETVALRWEGLKYLRDIIGDDNLKLINNGSWDLITNDDLPNYQRVADQLESYNAEIKKITGEESVYTIDDKVAHKFGLANVVTSFYNRLEGQIDTASMNNKFYELAIANNIQVLFGIEAKEINGTIISTNIGQLTGRNIAICTNGFAKIFLPDEDISPARAQVLVTNQIDGLKINGTFHYQKGYYYFRNIDGRILFGGGRNLDFQKETTTEMANTENIMSALKEILSNVILPNTPYNIDYEWAGIMGVGKDKKPIIKQVDEHVYCGVRLGGMGVAIGTLVGKQLAEMIKS